MKEVQRTVLLKRICNVLERKLFISEKFIDQVNGTHLKTIFSLGLTQFILMGYPHPFFIKNALLWGIKENVEY